MMKSTLMLIIYFLGVIHFPLIAEQKNNCVATDKFFPYKAGVFAEKKGTPTTAFNIYCNLAYKGDYRAQFKLAQYFSHGIPELVEPDKVQSYLWASLSNYSVKSKKRERFILQLEKSFAEDELNKLKRTVHKARKYIPVGARIDMQYKALDLEKLIEKAKKDEKKVYTGSRLKSKKPPGTVSVIQY